MRYNVNNPKRPLPKFSRFTIVNGSTTRSPMLNEIGVQCDTAHNAGPAFFDYSPLMVVSNLTDSQTTGGPTSELRYLRQREYTWVICDGRLMGPNLAGTFPIESDSATQHIQWQDCEYVVFDDIQFEIVISACHPSWIPTYKGFQIEMDDNDHEDGAAFSFERQSGEALTYWLDSKNIGAIEAEGGDVWTGQADMFETPYIVTLMRCPVIGGGNDQTSDLIQYDSSTPRFPLALAPIGMLMSDEVSDIPNYVDSTFVTDEGFSAWHPYTFLEGTSEYFYNGGLGTATELGQWRERQYRAWEPYDDLEGAFLFRKAYSMGLHVPPNDNVQDVWAYDDELLEGFESVGTPAHPRMANGKKLMTIKGGFSGQITVSKNDPRPLILHIAGAPCRIAEGGDVGGDIIHRFYRPPVVPIRWSLTANIKVR